MRPRPVGLGNAGSTKPCGFRKKSFNEAEARGPRKCPPRQWTAGPVSRASMRPRPVGLGNGAAGPGGRRQTDASMRPRPVGLGNAFASRANTTSSIGFNEAEARGPRKCRATSGGTSSPRSLQ